ncbi:glycosyltransferase family 4 protein [Tumebacillus flagellatus]|uniref:Glycosyl transferase family 1 domain-containing protein n=1 Tax=Tumebacillus flagellatus TaxID=1157490 RepID=A0A074LTL5_9BACL|nr:glycosyltransferase family 4 protein [Tumebacillus flagellatus]KEO83935.1 hypothetical protein EL26_07030 [Tumebacillus flagellatus]
MRGATGAVRIGYVGGQSKRRYERVIQGWAKSLSEEVELVTIPPFAFMKLFGGSIQHWIQCLPESLPFLSEGLERLGRQYGLDVWYVNVPMLAPYLMMARNYGQLDLGFLLVAHSAGSEAWLRQWTGVAPWITERDVLVAGTKSVKQALLNVSAQFAGAIEVPPCLAVAENGASGSPTGLQLLAVGVDEGKNIEALLDCFAAVRTRVPQAHLTLLGEFGVRAKAAAQALQTAARGGGVSTAPPSSLLESWARTVAFSFAKLFSAPTSAESLDALEAAEVERARLRVMELAQERGLADGVDFSVPATEEARDGYFAGADVLIDFSTDPGETLGLHLLQAKACGLPVVCTRWNGFGELVESDGDGWLVDVKWDEEDPGPIVDLQGAADAIVAMLLDRERRERLSQRAKERVRLYDSALRMPRVTAALQEAGDHTVEWDRLVKWSEQIEQVDDAPEHAGPLNPVEHSLFSRSDMEVRRSVANAVHHLAVTPLGHLGHIYNLANLEGVDWLDETPLSVLTGGTKVPLAEWYAKVRNIIGHYAGRASVDLSAK